MQVGNLERLFMVKLEEEILGVNRWRESRKENKVEEYLDSYYKTKKTNPFVPARLLIIGHARTLMYPSHVTFLQ